MEKGFRNNNQEVRKPVILLFFIVLYLGYSLLSCRNSGCLDCDGGLEVLHSLHLAASEGDIKEVERLLDGGTDVDNNENYHRKTALHYAVQGGHEEVVLLLIGREADVNKKDSRGITPLHYVKTKEMAKILLENRAKITAKDNQGRIPLHQAISRGKTELALFLVNQGGAKGYENEILNFAVWRNEIEVAKLIFQKGANPCFKNKQGRSAMYFAEWRNNQELIGLFKTYNSCSSRDYVYTSDCKDARTVMKLFKKWIKDYNHVAPHSGLGMKSPLEYRKFMDKVV